MSVAVCVLYVSWGLLDVWGELASHKKSLTHQPSSQGWACLFVWVMVGGVTVLIFIH